MSTEPSNVIPEGDPEGPASESLIVSKPLFFFNRSGKALVGVHDSSTTLGASKGLVVLVPGFGKTKVDHLSLAYFLAVNGFDAIRYDHSNHVGDSEGSMIFTTLSQMTEDLASVLDYVEVEMGIKHVGVVSTSLGARVALKHAAEDTRVQLFVSLIGVFNVQGTLKTIYQEDGFEELLQGVHVGIRDVLGFQVDTDNFLRDAYQNEFHNLQTSIKDISNLSIPTVFFVADNDPWVSFEEVQSIFHKSSATQREFRRLIGSIHELQENVEAAGYACRNVVIAAEKYLNGVQVDESTVLTPDQNVLTARLRKERKRTSKELNTDEEKRFWAQYLEKYAYIVNLQDYWNLLDLVSTNLGEVKQYDKVLDAGCGIGNFGSFLLVRQLYRAIQRLSAALNRRPSASYVGIDFVPEAIQKAFATHSGIIDEFKNSIKISDSRTRIVDFSYSLVDLNDPLPFKANTFDKICCNLVLSYLKKPIHTAKELFRVLKPRGRIVVTSLKPHADLSEIYRNYVRASRQPEELNQARLVLSNAGLIKHKEAEGYYQFFSEPDLITLLKESGFDGIYTSRAFGNQANVAAANKGSS